MESSSEEEGDDFSTLAELGGLLDAHPGLVQCAWCTELFFPPARYPLNGFCSQECYEYDHPESEYYHCD